MKEWPKPEWVKDLKVGDDVFQVEKHPTMPNGEWHWKAKIIKIESNYIETEYCRDRNLEWLMVLTKKLAPHHRTYSPQFCKNYFSPNGEINLKPYNAI